MTATTLGNATGAFVDGLTNGMAKVMDAVLPPKQIEVGKTMSGLRVFARLPKIQPAEGEPDCRLCRNHGYLDVETHAQDARHEPMYEALQCPDCIKRQKAKRIAALNSISSWSRSAVGQTFENYIRRDPTTMQACDLVRRWVETSSPSWVYIHGAPGNGKTHLAAAAANALTNERETPTVFITSPELLGWLRDAFDLGPNEFDERPDFATRLQLVMDAPVLILDDLGAEKGSEWVDETLWRILDSRYRQQRKTLICSNLNPRMLSEARITSRIGDRALCVTMEVTADDWRRKSKAEREAIRATVVTGA